LKQLLPTLWVLIAGWERNYVEKSAAAFTKTQLKRLHLETEDSEKTLFFRAYAAVAMSFAARSGET